MTPYTDNTVHRLAREGKRRVLVFSLSFLGDCIETLHEIRIELGAEFKQNGGEVLEMMDALNEFPRWVQGFKSIIQEHTNENLISRK